MALKTSSDWPGRRISHGELEAKLSARRAALGSPELSRNSGKRRTASKQALLAEIEKAGGRW